MQTHAFLAMLFWLNGTQHKTLQLKGTLQLAPFFRQGAHRQLQMLLYLKKDKNAWKFGAGHGCSASPLMRCWTSTLCRR